MADKGLYNLLIDIRANIANLQRDMDQAQGVLKKATSGFGSVMRGFFEGFGQELSRGLISNIGQISKAIGNLASDGDKLGAIADNFKALGGSSEAIKRAQDAVLGTVNAFDLMQAANAGLLKGIPNLNENFDALARYANQLADATGQDTVPVLNELIAALGSGKVEALKKFGFELGEVSSKADATAQAIAQLNERSAEMGELGVSVTQGQEAFAAAIATARGQVSIAINNNEELARVYNDLAVQIKKIDWVSVGNDVASMISSIVSMLPYLNDVVTSIGKIAQITRSLSGNSTKADSYNIYGGKLQAEIAALEKQKASMQGDWILSAIQGGPTKESLDRIDNAIEAKRRDLKILEDLLEKEELLANNAGAPFPLNKPAGYNTREDRNTAAFERKLAKDKEDANKKAVEKEADERLKALEQYNDEQMRLTSQAMAAEYDARRSQFQDLVGTFEDLFSGSILGLFPIFSRLAASFANDVGEALSGVFGSGGSGSGGGFMDFLGSTMSTEAAHGQGIQGPGLENGSFGAASSGAPQFAAIMQGANMAFQMFQGLLDARQVDAENGNFSATGQVLGTAIGGGPLGGFIGGQIGGLFGRGSQNAETQGRHTFANYMEDRFREMGGFNVRDGNGGSERITNFLEGSSGRFNDDKWADALNSQADDVKKTFSGLGEAFREMLGITEDVGGQIALMLGENLKFNIDNARMLVKRLGLSFEDLEEQLVEVGRTGKRTWLEIESEIIGVEEAFKPGLAAVGDFKSAFENLINSGARGFEAVQSIRDIAVEAQEAGISNLEELRKKLLETYDPEVVDKFFQSLDQRGITTIEQIISLDDRGAGQIVADMQAAGVQFKDTGKKIGDSLSQNTSSTDANTRALNENTRAQGGKPAPEPESDVEVDVEMARGGVITGPTRALMGEAGPEAVLPLTRRNGKLGVAMFGNIAASGLSGGGYTIHVDARESGPGVEKSVRSALRTSERRVLDSISRNMKRSRRTT